MPERQPGPTPDNQPDDTWSLEQLTAHLEAERAPVNDPAFGPGERLLIGPEQALSLELYPATGALRITSAHGRIELFQQPVPYLQEDLLLFGHDHGDEELQLAIDRHGSVALRILPRVPSAPVESPPLNTSDVDVQDEPHPPETDHPGPSSPLQEDASMMVESADDESDLTLKEAADRASGKEKETQPRLTITGRLGRNPHFRTTRNGALIASFPVAVLEDDGSTTWHRVVAFRERAEKLRDALKSGDRVEVIGYLHQRERQTRDGATRTVEELYAAVIKPR